MRGFLRVLLVTWILPSSVALSGDAETTDTLHAIFTIVSPGFDQYLDGTLPVAWGDYDNDGYSDLPLYHNNRDGTFSEIPGFRDLLKGGNYHGAAWGDYDNDGYLDLSILGYERGPSLLLHNQKNGTFKDVAPELGMDVIGGGETCIWGDYDGDGNIDLFAPYYAHISPFRSFLYHNNGNGTFTDVASELGVALAGIPQHFRPEGAQWADIDDDGDLDLYCASHLFRNDGPAGFVDIRASMGLPQVFDEGINFVDFDNDGDLDVYIRTLDGGLLFRRDGAKFKDVTAQSHIPFGGAIWGDDWGDVDNDGDLDLFYFREAEPAVLLLNDGKGVFTPDQDFVSLNIFSNTAAFGDFDRDGDLDIASGASWKILFENKLNELPGFADSYIRVRVLNSKGNKTCQGAMVCLHRIDQDIDSVQTRVVDGGSGYLTQGSYNVHFGVHPEGIYELRVCVPSTPEKRAIVDRNSNPALAAIRPTELVNKLITVYSDGRVTINGETLTPLTAVDEPRWKNYR